MKGFKVFLFLMAACMLVIGLSGTASAFHGGGVAHCDGCHSMHNTADNPISGAATNLLLKGSDASSTCLNCHNGSGGYHVNSTNGSNTNSGGDFYWVANPYTVNVRGNLVTFGGENAGHNIVAADYGYVADTTNTTAPMSTTGYSATLLGCTSCHDAHGQVLDGTKGGQPPISVSGSYGGTPVAGTIAGNYRLLGDSKYEAGNHTSDGFDFTTNAPIAVANGSNGATVDYGSGMSEWCMNCHDNYTSLPGRHVAGATATLNGYGTNYNSYVATGNFTGMQSTAFLSLVPFERGVGATLSAGSTEGPRATDTNNVMCLTCHRAHASAHDNAGRWDLSAEYIAESHALESPDVPASAAPYYIDGTKVDVATVFGDYQRSLCNKCHVQD